MSAVNRAAGEVSVEEELARVIPVVEAIAQRFEVWISVDTSKAEVIRQVAGPGAYHQRYPLDRQAAGVCLIAGTICRRRRSMRIL